MRQAVSLLGGGGEIQEKAPDEKKQEGRDGGKEGEGTGGGGIDAQAMIDSASVNAM